MTNQLHSDWKALLKEEFNKDYFKELLYFLEKEYSSQEVYPKKELIFNALNLCPFSETKVVVLGQDPYHAKGQAHGLAFSVPDGIPIPPSLRNIYKEMGQDLERVLLPNSGNLEHWAKQGILLLNATLTVQAHQAASHQKKGWEQFTDAIIRILNSHKQGLVFLLWGDFAKKKIPMIDANKHLILTAHHPSPLSANRGGWFGCRHFSKTNLHLSSQGLTPIEW